MVYFFQNMVKSLRRVRRVARRKPRCLCFRSLGETILQASDFRILTCSKGVGCKKPKYLHPACALFYRNTVRRCPFCKGKLVIKKQTVSLRDSLFKQRQQMDV